MTKRKIIKGTDVGRSGVLWSDGRISGRMWNHVKSERITCNSDRERNYMN